MDCHRIGEDRYQAYDDFVEAQRGGSLFHTTPWLRSLDQPFVLYVCENGSSMVAVVPVVEQRRFGRTIVAQPLLTPYLGVVAADSGLKAVSRISLWNDIASSVAETLRRDYPAVEINLSPHWPDVHGFIWGGYRTAVRYTYTVDLARLDDLWTDMDAKRRNDIRRATKDGVVVEELADFAAVRRAVLQTFTRQGMQPAFLDVAERAHAMLRERDRCSAWLARRPESDEVVAAVYLVWDKRRAYYLLGGYDASEGHGGAHALAIWTAIQAMSARGLQEFDFEGSDVPQIERYFRKFGGRLTPYYTVTWESPVIRAATTLERASALPGRAWRKLFPGTR
jgi:hypothetical protein